MCVCSRATLIVSSPWNSASAELLLASRAFACLHCMHPWPDSDAKIILDQKVTGPETSTFKWKDWILLRRKKTHQPWKHSSKFWKLFQKFPSEVLGDCVFRLQHPCALFDQHSAPPKAPAAASSVPQNGRLEPSYCVAPLLCNVIWQTYHGCSAVFPDLGNLKPKYLKELNSWGIFTDNICDIQSIQHSNQTPNGTPNNRFSLSIWSINILHSLHQALYRVPQHRRQSPWISSPTSGWKVWDIDLGSIFYDFVLGLFMFETRLYTFIPKPSLKMQRNLVDFHL